MKSHYVVLPWAAPRLSPLHHTGAIQKVCGTRTVVILKSHCTIVSSSGADGREEVKALLFYEDKQERAVREANHPHSSRELLPHRTQAVGNPTTDDICAAVSVAVWTRLARMCWKF